MSVLDYATSLQLLFVLGGLTLLMWGTLGLVGGLTAMATFDSDTPAPTLVQAARLFGVLAWPWVVILSTGRGVMGAGSLLSFSNSAVAMQVGLLLLGVALLLSGVLQFRAGVGARWVFEYLGAVLLLLFCWHVVWQAASLFTALLWLELTSLAAVLLLCFTVLGQPRWARGAAGWSDRFFGQQQQLGFLQALLAFLWGSGLSALLLLWGFAYSTLVSSGLEYWQLALLTGTQGAPSGGWTQYLTMLLLVLGVLFKLLLQPFQFFLVLFYKQLPLVSVAAYLSYYYCLLVPALVLQVCGFIFCLGTGGGLFVSLGSVFLLVSILAGLGAVVDLRTTLAFSTLFNLSLLLIVVAGLR